MRLKTFLATTLLVTSFLHANLVLEEPVKTKNFTDWKEIEHSLQTNPNSPEAGILWLNLGLQQRQTGAYSKALTSFENAWNLLKTQKDNNLQLSRALGELAELNARLGRYQKVEELLTEGKTLHPGFSGIGQTKISFAEQGLWQEKNTPETAFKCGPYALGTLLRQTNPTADLLTIKEYPSTQKGTSLSQLATLSKELKIPMVAAKKTPTTEPTVPSIVHLKTNHFAAIIQQDGNQYLLKDPTFGEDTWLSRETLEEETNGYYLIPEEKLTTGWTPVSSQEASNIWGKGAVSTTNPNAIGPSATTLNPTDSTCSIGMPVANVNTLGISLMVQDTPVGYTPPVGPAVFFTLTANEQDALQKPNTTWLGPKITCNWVSYVIDTPGSTAAAVTIYEPGGGGAAFGAFTGTSNPLPSDGSKLIRVSGTSYTRNYPDGSSDEYTLPNGASTYPRLIFLTARKDRNGNTVTISYDANKAVSTLTDAIGQVTTFTYGLTGDNYRITRVTDPFGRYADFTYSSTGKLETITDVMSMTSSLTRATTGDLDAIVSITTPYGTTSFNRTYSGVNRKIEITDPMGGTEIIEFQSPCSLIPFSVPSTEVPVTSGVTYFNQYMNYRNTLYWNKKGSAEYPNNPTRITQWLHMKGNITQAADVPASTIPYGQRRIWFTYPGQPTTYEAGTLNVPTNTARRIDTSNTANTAVTYNSLGAPLTITDPLGRETTYTYDASDFWITQIHQTTGSLNELLASFTYDSNHNQLTSTDTAGETTTNTFNAKGQLLTSTNPKSEVTTLTYDGDYYLTSIDGPATGDTTTLGYDAKGRLNSITDSDGDTTSYTFDNLDRTLTITYPDTKTESFTYDKLDLATSTDRAGQISRFQYNANRQMVLSIAPNNATMNFDFCTCGALDAMWDANGNKTTWTRDAGYRTLWIQQGHTDPVTGNTPQGFQYDPITGALNKTGYGEYGSGFAYNEETYTYNLDGTLAQKTYKIANIPTPITYTYDSNYPRLTSITAPAGTTTYSYNAITGTPTLGAGRLSTITPPITDAEITYTYDELGRIASRSVHSVAESYTYDNLGRITQVVNPLGTTTYGYDGVSNRLILTTLPNGATSERTYANGPGLRMLTQIKNLDPSSAITSQFDYDYDVMKNITTWAQTPQGGSPKTWTLQYDTAGRLTHGIRKDNTGTIDKTRSWVLDKMGNATSNQNDDAVQTGRFNDLNQLLELTGGGQTLFTGTTDKPTTVTATVSGVITEQIPKTGPETSFTLLPTLQTGSNSVTITAEDVNGNTSNHTYSVTLATTTPQTFSYDIDGTQVYDTKRIIFWNSLQQAETIHEAPFPSNRITTNTFDGLGQRIREVIETGGIVTSDKTYVWADNTQLEERDTTTNTVLRRFYAQGEQVVGATSPNDKLFYMTDHIGSPREVLDSTGTVVAEYAYDLYGKRTKISGNTDTQVSFTGHWELGMGYLSTRFRLYDPETGRWLSEDPIGFEGGYNLYQYCFSDPINLWDPYGLFSFYEAFEIASDYSAGFGDTISFGATAWIRESLPSIYGDDGGINKCSDAYFSGEITGVAHSLISGKALAKGAIQSGSQMFWETRKFQTVSRAYWKSQGGAQGKALHHWLFTQEMKFIPAQLRNAGFNTVPITGKLNTYMGFAQRWGGISKTNALTAEWTIRTTMLGSLSAPATFTIRNTYEE